MIIYNAIFRMMTEKKNNENDVHKLLILDHVIVLYDFDGKERHEKCEKERDIRNIYI